MTKIVGAIQPFSGKKEEYNTRLHWWREARFGMFLHWGPVSLTGKEIAWSRAGERRGYPHGGAGSIPVEVYDSLFKKFNPVKFDAEQWVQIARDAGMRYMIFISKCHDGFSNFDSKLTEYKITSPKSPFRRDIVAELARACHKNRMPLGFYYSPPDWWHKDYRTENHDRYIKYFHGQVRELCSNYGKLAVLWFDGLGGSKEDWDAEALFKMIKQLQPDIIINNRCGLPADYDTPEQKIGDFQIERPWETCMTLGAQWAWKPDDNIKSLKQCIQTFVRVAGGDGNFLFNTGPMPDGRIEPRQAQRLREMGEWLALYGESVYGTRGGPYKPAPWGVTTRKGNRIYVHIFGLRGEELLLPAIAGKIIDCTVLTGGKVGHIKQSQKSIAINISKQYQRDIDTIVVLKFAGAISNQVIETTDREAKLEKRKAAPPPQIKVPKISKGKDNHPKGDLLKINWAKAVVAKNWHTVQGDETDRKPAVRLIHDGKYLYIQLEELNVSRLTISAAGIWEGDDWEIFFADQRGKMPYRQVCIGADGRTESFEMNKKQESPPKIWKSGAKVRSEISKTRWLVSLAFPLDKLLSGGARPGKKLYANFCRATPKPADNLAWSPIFTDNFHELSRLGELIFE